MRLHKRSDRAELNITLPSEISLLRISPNEEIAVIRLSTEGVQYRSALVDLTGVKPLREVTTDSPVEDFCFTADGEQLGVLCKDQRVRFWKLTDLSSHQVPEWTGVLGLYDNTLNSGWVTRHHDGLIHLWANESAKTPLRSWSLNSGEVFVGISTEHNLVASRGSGGAVGRLWSLDTGIPVGPPVRLTGMIAEIQWASAGVSVWLSGKCVKLVAVADPKLDPHPLNLRAELTSFTGMDGDRCLSDEEWSKIMIHQSSIAK